MFLIARRTRDDKFATYPPSGVAESKAEIWVIGEARQFVSSPWEFLFL